MSGPLVLALVLATHYGYLRWADRADQQWHFYVASMALLTVVLLLLLPMAERLKSRWNRYAGLFGCWLGAIESSQAAACGALEWRQPVEDELCSQAFGPEFFLALSAVCLAVAAMLAWQLWRARHGRA